MLSVSGKRRNIAIAATAGNATTRLSPGTNKRWLVIRVTITLACNVAVADRYITLFLTDGANVLERLGVNSAAITASQTKTIDFGEGRLVSNATFGTDFGVGISPVLLQGSDDIYIQIVGGQAGDSYSGRYTVLEVDA